MNPARPDTANPSRIAENHDGFDFELTADDLAAASQSARRARICSRRMSACPAC